MKNLIIICSISILFSTVIRSEISPDTYSKEDIGKLAGAYLENKLSFENPVFVDVDKDGDFDALKFDDGNVEYYVNTGTLEEPSFKLENKHYDNYSSAFIIDPKIPYPMFFADMDGDNDMDMFVIKDRSYVKDDMKYSYKVAAAENALDLDTGTLITIILVLVIVLLILAIVH